MLQRVSGRDRAMVLRSLGVMFNSGCSLTQSLAMLAEQAESKLMADACQHLYKQLQAGHYLSAAMQKIPWVFTRLHIKMVQVGENSGKLGSVLLKLAEYEDRQIELQMKIRNALTMPLIICSMCVLMVLIGPPFLFGNLFAFLSETGGQLPWPTRLLMALSQALKSPVFWILAGLLTGAGVVAVRRHGGSPRVFQKLLQLPALGAVFQLLVLTRFAQALQSMLEVGIGLVQALQLASQACDCRYLELAMDKCIEQVKEGDSLAEAFAQVELFPGAFVQSVAAGEESGSLSAMLGSLARLYQVELDHSLDLLTKSLEPVVLGLVGGIVCFVVVATLSPMLKLVESL